MNNFEKSFYTDKKRIYILIDDLREMGNESNYDFVFRDSKSALDYFNKNYDVSNVFLYIDNDLGEGQMEGRKILDIILERESYFCPNDVFIVSSNPVGVNYMRLALKDKKYLITASGRHALMQSL